MTHRQQGEVVRVERWTLPLSIVGVTRVVSGRDSTEIPCFMLCQ